MRTTNKPGENEKILWVGFTLTPLLVKIGYTQTMGDFYHSFYMFFFSKVDFYLFVNPVGTGTK